MSNLSGRLERLEEQVLPYPAHWSNEEWPANDQLEDVLHILKCHRWGRSVYPATDRELNILAMWCAYHELLGAPTGEWVAPESGAVITLTDNGDGTFNAGIDANVSVEDLPESVSKYVERMDPERQAERERWLFEHRGDGLADYGGPR